MVHTIRSAKSLIQCVSGFSNVRDESYCPLWLDVLQRVCDLDVGSDDIPVGLCVPRASTAIPQLPKHSVETLSTRPVHEQHEQQADAAPREEHKLGHAQKRSIASGQLLLPWWEELCSSHQRHTVEELAEKHDHGDRQEHRTLLGAGEEPSFRLPLPDTAAYQKSQLEHVGNHKSQAEPCACIWNTSAD